MGEWIFGLFRVRRLAAMQQLAEDNPEAAPYIVGFIIGLPVMVMVVNKFTDWINRG